MNTNDIMTLRLQWKRREKIEYNEYKNISTLYINVVVHFAVAPGASRNCWSQAQQCLSRDTAIGKGDLLHSDSILHESLANDVQSPSKTWCSNGSTVRSNFTDFRWVFMVTVSNPCTYLVQLSMLSLAGAVCSFQTASGMGCSPWQATITKSATCF